jgi:glycosyltransferase involved in cell wall biosynthesis
MSFSTILVAHNSYRRAGGEDRVFAAETALLQGYGHHVVRYQDSNERIGGGVLTGLAAVWNGQSYSRLRALVASHRPGAAHFHNTFPLISPAGYYAAKNLGVPVVQTLSNFRLLCPGGLFLRDGHECEQCLEQRSLWPAVVHKCYRGSRLATGAVAGMLSVHRATGTWQEMVDVYIALSHYARGKFIEGGLPQHRIALKGNFVTPDPGPGNGNGNYALFVGRLSEEKGIRTLAETWNRIRDIPLLVAGDGPLNGTQWPQV